MVSLLSRQESQDTNCFLINAGLKSKIFYLTTKNFTFWFFWELPQKLMWKVNRCRISLRNIF